MKRASKFQGYVPLDHMKPLQLVKYRQGEYYKSPYDAWQDRDPADGNRMTSFFVISRSTGLMDGEGKNPSMSPSAGTRFPRIRRTATSNDICNILECEEGQEEVVVRPKSGQRDVLEELDNLCGDGTVHPNTIHQGTVLPDKTDREIEEIGLIICTWTQPCLDDLQIIIYSGR